MTVVRTGARTMPRRIMLAMYFLKAMCGAERSE
jgi:hypothetical protein